MSEFKPQTEVSELTPEEIRKLIEKASPTEWKYILKLTLEKRKGGCGYVYRWWSDINVLCGDADIVKLSRNDFDECTWEEEILIVPRTTPTIVLKTFRSDEPRDQNYINVFIFDRDGWKSVRAEIPK